MDKDITLDLRQITDSGFFIGYSEREMGVEPKIGGKTPKWMVKIMENPMNKWMIWGYHYFWKHPNKTVKQSKTFLTLSG